jgi:Na+-transporting methylmalonyl-CoA/oxaloacetate decarboxylase gamma subunit
LIKNPKHIKGKFIGIYESKNADTIGMFTISKIHWTYLKIEELEILSDFDFEAVKTGDFWFSKKITQKTKLNFYRKTTEVFIPQGETEYFSQDLHNVIIKNISIQKDTFSFKPHAFIEATGDIYFQVETKPKVVELPIENKVEPIISSTGSGVNVDESGLHLIESQPEIVVAPITAAPISTPSSNQWIWNLLGIFFWVIILRFCWTSAPNFFYIFLVVAVGWLLTRFLGKSGLGKIFSFLFIFILFIYGLTFLSNKSKNLIPVETKEGKIKISPPIKTQQQEGNNNKDFSTEKEIQWFDFIKNQYLAKYATRSLMFFESQKKAAQLAKNGNPSNTISYFNGLYIGMVQNDNLKIKDIVKQFAEKAQAKNLNQLETAEMVTTFVQEIPYCLVHDYTCQQIIENSNSSFVTIYHRDGKPCLPNVPGGVQSPYEFLHNLKGDCDTRSLLAFAILKELHISASIWVSETYGHSILGVGLPVAGGVHKMIDGVNHYGVELTAKGYRIGMVNPEHNNMSNWDIALSYNQH